MPRRPARFIVSRLGLGCLPEAYPRRSECQHEPRQELVVSGRPSSDPPETIACSPWLSKSP
eukprot:6223002-Pyramimonas_sp.AAC.1